MREQIRQGYRLLDAHDREGFAAHVRAHYAPDAQFVHPDGNRDLEGALAAWLGLLDAVGDIVFDEVAVTQEDGRVVVEHLVRGTHTGPLLTVAGEIPATGRSLRVPLVTVLEHEGGRIRRYRSYYDQLLLLGQLGVLPVPGG